MGRTLQHTQQIVFSGKPILTSYYNNKETNYFYHAVTGTIKKNIQTTTIYIFCVVWVLTVPKYIFIRLNLTHGPLKLRTVHFGDITIIYESKVSEQNIFPWLKDTIESRPHTKLISDQLFIQVKR
jgi:hypothetical protein